MRTWVKLGGFLVVCVRGCQPAPAWAEYDPNLRETYVQIAITEAASEGQQGMCAVLEVLRNRGWNVRGFCGLTRKDRAEFIRSQPERVHKAAWAALEEAKRGSNLVLAATHYENMEKYGRPAWAKKMRVVAKVGHHTFLK